MEAFGGSNYTWSGGLTPNSSDNSFDVSGTYTVNYIDSNNCPLQMEVVVYEDYSLPTILITNNTNSTDELNCIFPNIELNSSGGDSYVWGGSLGSGNLTSINTAGTYEVTGTGANGCENTASIVITEDFISPNIDISNLSEVMTL